MLLFNICFVNSIIHLLVPGLITLVGSEETVHDEGFTVTSKVLDDHAKVPHGEHIEEAENVYKIKMSNVTTSGEDEYVCIDWSPSFSGKHFITRFEAFPDDPNVHHMLLYACKDSPKKLGHASTCDNDCNPGLIYFAWARNAPPTNLPEGVGFLIGAEGVDYLQLQVHYRTMVTKPDQTQLFLTVTSKELPNSAGVLLLASASLSIPAHTEKVIGNVSCLFKDDTTLHPFAFRTHAHMLGKVISGYVVHDSEWKNIGRGNPNWPQAFWPAASNDIVIRKGDYLVAKCVYSSIDYHVNVKIGGTHNDEMCNFYIMYYHSTGEPRPISDCYDDGFPEISAKAPTEATELLPPNPALDALGEGQMPGHHHHHSHNSNIVTEKIVLPPVANWPNFSSNFQLGHTTGISIDDTFAYILHRGKTKWDDSSFDITNIYQNKNEGPIKEDVLVILNSTTGVPVTFWGSNFFYMPHGLHVDKDKIIWITDVAMHQVFKFRLPLKESDNIAHPLITLGSEFSPGSDEYHFCKPAGVITNLTGSIFVADGYCNNRIVIFDRFGTFMTSLKIDNGPGLPHSISIDEVLGLVYVADRINAKIWGFNSSTGTNVKQIQHNDFKPELFALSYNSAKDRLFCVNGKISPKDMETYHVMIVDPETGSILSMWDLPHMHNALASPHDIAVSPQGDFVVVAVLDDPGKIFRFDSASSNDFGLKGKTNEKTGVIYHRRPIGKFMNDGHGVDQEEYRKYKLTLIFVVILCLFVFPLSVIVAVAVYIRNKRKNHDGYSHLEAAQQVNRRYNGKSTGEVIKTFVTGKASIPETIREEELKRLESESEEEFSIQDFKGGQI